MSKLWNWVNETDFSSEEKVRLFLCMNSLLFCIFGFIVWLIVRNFTCSTWNWALCFIGYPGFFLGYLGGLVRYMAVRDKNRDSEL